jgi:nitrite reductase/ring-hydroxylating ferredoxin subunit
MYEEDFVLKLEINDFALREYYKNKKNGEAVIYYTTNGTIPANNSKKYDGGGIEISGDTKASGGATVCVIRAAAFDAQSGEMIGRASSASYIYAKSGRFECAVISLITDPDNIYGYENGIYANGKLYDAWLDKPEHERYILPDANYVMRGMEWERPVHIEFFEPDGTPGFSQNAGIRTAGGLMRIAAHKSLKIFARSMYDPQKKQFCL